MIVCATASNLEHRIGMREVAEAGQHKQARYLLIFPLVRVCHV